MKLKFANALSLALIMAMLFTSIGLADDISNNIDADIDATLESISLPVGGSNGAVGFYLQPRNGDGDTGCNIEGTTEKLVVSVNSSNTSVATVSPNSLTFDNCSDTPSITVTPVGVGSATISLSQATNNTGGTFNLNPASFTVNVNAPADSTAPSITSSVSGTLGYDNWYTSDVTISWTVTDNESAISSSNGCGSTTISTDTAGTTLTCSATSAGGNASNSVTIKRDATAPTISGSATPDPNGAGWNNSDVAVTFTCGDNLSGVASCGPDATLSADGADQSAGGTAFDNAGNSANTTVSDINIDQTAPVVTATASPAPNANGWNKTDVTVSFSGTDGLSGIASCDPNVVLSSEDAAQSATGSCADQAGNSASAIASNINIDKTAPSVSLVGGPANGSSYYFGSVPAAPTCTASDGLSGLVGACSVSGYSTAVGTHTVTASASDNAGNSASASATYTVLAWTLSGFYQPVDMNGVYNTVKGGSTVPFKFEIFAGATELTDTSAISSLAAARVTCSGSGEDAIEITATGGTSLRYDAVAGQFIYNWKTPTGAGTCYKVTMTTADGSSLVAFFKMK